MSRDADGPDFICVGLPKCGTGWLFDQLDGHPDFWMTPVKELHYLNRSSPPLRFVDKKVHDAKLRSETGQRIGERALRRNPQDRRDIAFVEYARSIQGLPMTLERYARLFRPKENLLSGDITPPYFALDGDLIARIAVRFPETKIVIMVRDPVARISSRLSVLHGAGKFDSLLLSDPGDLREFVLRRQEPVATKLVARWRKLAPGMELGVFLFDKVVDDPKGARREILEFLGANPEKDSGDLSPSYNRKATYSKLEIPEAAKAVLADLFKDELFACAEMFGERAREWPARYGL